MYAGKVTVPISVGIVRRAKSILPVSADVCVCVCVWKGEEVSDFAFREGICMLLKNSLLFVRPEIRV